MKYALERLSQLVDDVIRIKDGNEEKIEEFIHQSRKEKGQIEKYLLRRSLNIKSEREFELLIQQYQGEIIRLLDLVFQKSFYVLPRSKDHPLQRGASAHPSGRQLYKRVCDALLKDLEDLLSHIEHRYTRYFSLDERVPAKYLIVAQTELRKKIKILVKSLTSESLARKADTHLVRGIDSRHMDEELMEIVFSPLNAFVKKESGISYREMIYVKDLVEELESGATKGTMETQRTQSESIVTPVRDTPFNKGRIIDTLVYMNFNSGAFVHYQMRRIVDEINALSERNERLDRLFEHLSAFNQTHTRPGVGLNYFQLSLKEQITTWVSEEIQYLKERQTLLSFAPGLQEERIADKEKLHLSASVEVLTLLARSAKDSRLITNEHLSTVFKSIAKFVRTKGAASPKPHSMAKKGYEAPRQAKKVAIDFLHQMISKIHSY